MRLAEVAALLEAEPRLTLPDPGPELRAAFAADLMSDVLALARQGAILLTGLTTAQVVRTSEVAGVAAIVVVRGKRIQSEAARLAQEAEIPLLETELTLFEACGRLYSAGMRGCDVFNTLPTSGEGRQVE